MIPYAINIFLSAFLLFLIQPILSKALLPWFGGGASVWSSAMVFFQVALTGGYAYSNWLVMKMSRKAQTTIHLSLVTLIPSARWPVIGSSRPLRSRPPLRGNP